MLFKLIASLSVSCVPVEPSRLDLYRDSLLGSVPDTVQKKDILEDRLDVLEKSLSVGDNLGEVQGRGGDWGHRGSRSCRDSYSRSGNCRRDGRGRSKCVEGLAPGMRADGGVSEGRAGSGNDSKSDDGVGVHDDDVNV